MAAERTRAVCDGLRAALDAYGAPQQILTDIQSALRPPPAPNVAAAHVTARRIREDQRVRLPRCQQVGDERRQ
jgi:hypothetical protein